METGVYQIEFLDGSKWNLYFANSTQHKKIWKSYYDNKAEIQSITPIVNGIHTTNQLEGIFNEIKNRKNGSD